jgi:hypothetical protein
MDKDKVISLEGQTRVADPLTTQVTEKISDAASGDRS